MSIFDVFLLQPSYFDSFFLRMLYAVAREIVNKKNTSYSAYYQEVICINVYNPVSLWVYEPSCLWLRIHWHGRPLIIEKERKGIFCLRNREDSWEGIGVVVLWRKGRKCGISSSRCWDCIFVYSHLNYRISSWWIRSGKTNNQAFKFKINF